MSKRLEILKKSLNNKEKLFDDKIQHHFDTVKEANGQPLNDKRNGRATLNKWERQKDSLRNLKGEIEKTKKAIDIEEDKIYYTEAVKEILPKEILDLIETGHLIQWRKHPNFFFVKGVDKARLVWDKETKILSHRYTNEIKDKEQWKTFANTFNSLKNSLYNNQPNPKQRALALLKLGKGKMLMTSK